MGMSANMILRSVIPIVYIRTTVDQWSRNSSQKTQLHLYVPPTCFGSLLTGHHQVEIQCQRNYIPTINIVISVSVSTEKRGRGRDLVYKIKGMCVDRCW